MVPYVPLNLQKISVKFPIFPDPQLFNAFSLNLPGKNEEYWMLDTGAVLKTLYSLSAILYRLERDLYKLAILEKTITEVVEHLKKSYSDKKMKNLSTHGVEEGMRNLIKLLRDGSVKLILNPEEIPRKLIDFYERYDEDKLLIYVAKEGKFKGIVTKDGKLIKKLKNFLKVLNPQKLITANSCLDP